MVELATHVCIQKRKKKGLVPDTIHSKHITQYLHSVEERSEDVEGS